VPLLPLPLPLPLLLPPLPLLLLQQLLLVNRVDCRRELHTQLGCII
jgi:hypothetical protein